MVMRIKYINFEISQKNNSKIILLFLFLLNCTAKKFEIYYRLDVNCDVYFMCV